MLWDASYTDEESRQNIVIACSDICDEYIDDFLPSVSRLVDPPPVLRCGIARGAVYSVGNGNDYVGTCINMAARLQKIAGATFAFNCRGFNLDDPDADKFFKKDIVVKTMSIRGIGQGERVALLRSEYTRMTRAERQQFSKA
ncbi:MAG TPA: hypothetical protein VEA40_15345 [Ramlibacter sp.]|nr:hypothetical protein [Ramlibacter sp.]